MANFWIIVSPQNCMEQSVPVRVVRGHKCQNSYVGKVYTYDGLYRVAIFFRLEMRFFFIFFYFWVLYTWSLSFLYFAGCSLLGWKRCIWLHSLQISTKAAWGTATFDNKGGIFYTCEYYIYHFMLGLFVFHMYIHIQKHLLKLMVLAVAVVLCLNFSLLCPFLRPRDYDLPWKFRLFLLQHSHLK